MLVSQYWLDRIKKVRKTKVIKQRFSRRNFKRLTFSLGRKKSYLRFIRYRKLFFYLLKYRQFLQRFLGKMKLKELKKIYFTSNMKKTRLYLFNFASSLELRLNSILYHTYLLSKLKLIRYLLEQNLILVNNQESRRKSSFITHPLDVIGFNNKAIIPISYYSLHRKFFSFMKRKIKKLKYVKSMLLRKKMTSSSYKTRCKSLVRKFLFLFFLPRIIYQIIRYCLHLYANNFFLGPSPDPDLDHLYLIYGNFSKIRSIISWSKLIYPFFFYFKKSKLFFVLLLNLF